MRSQVVVGGYARLHELPGRYEMGLGFRVPFQAGAEWRGTCSLDAALLFKFRMTVQGTIGSL